VAGSGGLEAFFLKVLYEKKSKILYEKPFQSATTCHCSFRLGGSKIKRNSNRKIKFRHQHALSNRRFMDFRKKNSTRWEFLN
jgi:hypothetical protein